jgi:hypothetical protein
VITESEQIEDSQLLDQERKTWRVKKNAAAVVAAEDQHLVEFEVGSSNNFLFFLVPSTKHHSIP